MASFTDVFPTATSVHVDWPMDSLDHVDMRKHRCSILSWLIIYFFIQGKSLYKWFNIRSAQLSSALHPTVPGPIETLAQANTQSSVKFPTYSMIEMTPLLMYGKNDASWCVISIGTPCGIFTVMALCCFRVVALFAWCCLIASRLAGSPLLGSWYWLCT